VYENVYIFKPNTSRIANSEKYIICINYKNNNKKIITNIIENFDLIINNIDSISSLFSRPLNKHFLTKVQEINAIYGEQQLENISATLNLIKELKALNIKYNLINNEYSALFKYLHVHSKSLIVNKCLINEIYNGLNDEKSQNSEDTSKNSMLIKYHNSNDNINEYFTKLNNIVIANIHKSINWCKKHQFAINKEFICY
jgi:hypothetical protein